MNESWDNQSWCSALYEAQAAGLILYGRALGLGHSESEDVVHEVFTALLQLETPPDRPQHYLVRAFRNRAFNRKTSLFRRLAQEFESHRWFERNTDRLPWEDAAMKCLAKLPPEQREVIVLKIWHAYTFDEIGELLKLSPNTAAGRYRYGLERLRQCLKHEENEIDESIGNKTQCLGAPSSLR